MFVNPDGKLQLATADIKEQLHHLPRSWTKTLPDHSRHRAIANGWHISAARWFVVLSIFLAQVPVNVAIPQERHPWGSNAIDFMVGLRQSAPLLAGPGVPVLGDALDLSSILSVPGAAGAANRTRARAVVAVVVALAARLATAAQGSRAWHVRLG